MATSGARCSTYLSRHGIHGRIVERSTDRPISEIILAEARSLQATYIVMGAYGHGRAVDMLFGGVSGRMLVRSELPLFLVH